MTPTRGGVSGVRSAMRQACACSLAFVLAACSPMTMAGDLPPALIDLAEDALPGYALPPKAEPGGRHLGFGDFDANGMEDVAALLPGEEDWQLVVFRQMEGGRYQADVIEQFPGSDREFKRRLHADDLTLEAVEKGAPLELEGTVIEDASVNSASLVLHLPAAEQTALLFKWNRDHKLFGTSRLRLAAAPSAKACAYDPQSGAPNPLGMRAAVTVEEQDGNTIFVYEQFPENLAGAAPATIATRRELVFHQTSIDQARALMREEPGYYQELTGDDDPAGFAPVDSSLVCQ